MFSNNIFAERLMYLRKSNNITQLRLAEIIGVSKSTVSLMESGKRGASIESIYQLADYFDVSIDYLVGRSDDPKRY